MDENKMYAFCWTGAFITLILAIFMIGSCVRDQQVASNKVKMECARAGGEWALGRGAQEYSCEVRR